MIRRRLSSDVQLFIFCGGDSFLVFSLLDARHDAVVLGQLHDECVGRSPRPR